jgi:drug/metabolite transporter (DMT)-like permease
MDRLSFVDSVTGLKRAILYTIVASFFSSVMALGAKVALQSATMPVILLDRYLVSVLLLFITVCASRKLKIRVVVKSAHPWLQTCRAIIGFASLACYFYSAQYLNLAMATVLFSVSPLLVPLVARFWKNVKFYKPLWKVLLLGFCGVVVILHPSSGGSSLGIILGLLSGFGAAIVVFSSRLLSYDESVFTTLLYDFCVGTLLSAVWLLASLRTIPSLGSNLYTVCMVGVSGYLYLMFFIMSTKYAPVRLSSPFVYSSTVFGIAFDWFFWGVAPNLYSVIGIICIIVSGVFIIRMYPTDRVI